MSGLRLRIKVPDLTREETTHLIADAAAGASSLSVSNNDDIAANDYLALGNLREEPAELVRVTSVTSNQTVTLNGTTKFAHGTNSPVVKSLYNQISVERKPLSGAYAQIAEGLVNIDIDDKEGYTVVSIAAGISTDTYRWRFYNLASGVYSAYSGELLGTGLPKDSVGYLIGEFRRLTGLTDHEAVPDDQIINWFNDAQDNIASEYDRWWFLQTESDTTNIANQYKFDLPSNFGRMEEVLFNDGTKRYGLKKITLSELDQYRINSSTNISTNTPLYWSFMPPDASNTKGYIGVHQPILTAGYTITQRYFKDMAALDSFDDKTPVPLPEMVVYWAIMTYYESKNTMNTSAYWQAKYDRGLTKLKRLQRRYVGGDLAIKVWKGHGGMDKVLGEPYSTYSDENRERYW